MIPHHNSMPHTWVEVGSRAYWWVNKMLHHGVGLPSVPNERGKLENLNSAQRGALF